MKHNLRHLFYNCSFNWHFTVPEDEVVRADISVSEDIPSEEVVSEVAFEIEQQPSTEQTFEVSFCENTTFLEKASLETLKKLGFSVF